MMMMMITTNNKHNYENSNNTNTNTNNACVGCTYNIILQPCIRMTHARVVV